MKTKVRFDGLDVAAMVAHLNRTAIGRRIVNIYNGTNDDTYIFKLEKLSQEQQPLLLLIESGIRFHCTTVGDFSNTMPTPFCSKLRKHLRGLRLEKIQQLGTYDRVVIFHFGSGEQQRHSLIMELYSRGNIIMVDSGYKILSVLRGYEYDNKKDDENDKNKDNKKNDDKVQVRVGHVYPITYATTMTSGDDTAANGDDDENNNEILLTAKDPIQWYLQQQQQQNDNEESNKKKKKKPITSIKYYLMKSSSGVSHYGPSLLDHCILQYSNTKSNCNEWTSDEWKEFQIVLQTEGTQILQNLSSSTTEQGYIIYRDDNNNHDDNDNQQQHNNNKFHNKLLLEFQPHLLAQHHTNVKHMKFNNFNQAVNEFYLHIQNQIQYQRYQTQELHAKQRLEKIQKQQEERIGTIEQQIVSCKYQAMAIEQNSVQVDQVLQVINSALNSGMDWDQLQQYIDLEQTTNQNPIALLISKLQLEQDSLVLRLPFEGDGDNDDDDNDDNKTTEVTVSLKETAFGNSTLMYENYRIQKDKYQKTIDASTKVFSVAEENVKRQLMEVQKQRSTTASVQRKPMWFEKFHWFITTENYLVIAGKDAQQNEQLYKKYLRKGDAYLHADVHGAASCILRAKRYRDSKTGRTVPLPLSDQALREAGNFTICKSSAWKSRMITSAWWVESHQVSKTAPTGEYLTVGSFMIRGKKNFLPPSSLEMGLAVLFRLGDDESIARHKTERRDFGLIAKEQELEADDGDDELFGKKQAMVNGNGRARQVSNSRAKNGNAGDDDDEDDLIEDISQLRVNGTSNRTTNEHEEPATTKHGPKDDAENGEKEPSSDQGKQEANGTIDNATPNDANNPTDTAIEARAPSQNDDATQDENKDDDNSETIVDAKPALSKAQQRKQKKGLSVRDRKLIRKYGSLEAAAEAEAERLKQEEAIAKNGSKSKGKNKSSDADSVMTNQSTAKRGKKAKMKKMMKKYSDQDEEERELAMLALHGGEKDKRANHKDKEPETNESEIKAANETLALLKKDPAEVAKKLPDEVHTVLAECVTVKSKNTTTSSAKDADGNGDDVSVRWDKFDADVLEQLLSMESEEQQVAAAKRLLNLKSMTRIDNFSGSLSGIIRTIRKYGHKNLGTEADESNNGDGKNRKTNEDVRRKTKAEKDAEDAEWKKTMAEEGVVEVDEDGEDAVDDTVELNRLTAKPDAKDLILHAVPVCAPYHTLSQYTYRVKLTPGNMKRGKAAKQCVEMFIKNPHQTPTSMQNKDMIKRLTDNDWVQALGVGDVKISAPGASKFAKNQKSKGKQKGGKSKKK